MLAPLINLAMVLNSFSWIETGLGLWQALFREMLQFPYALKTIRCSVKKKSFIIAAQIRWWWRSVASKHRLLQFKCRISTREPLTYASGLVMDSS